MRILCTITLVVLFVMPSVATRADGLIYRLPKDGTSVEFEMKGSFERNGQMRESNGTLTMSSVDSGLGKLQCKGVSGSTQFKQGERDHKYTFTNRLNDKSPFGVVIAEIKFEMSINGEQEGTGTMTLKLVKVGKDAVTGLPNSN